MIYPTDATPRKPGAWERLWDWFDRQPARRKFGYALAVMALMLVVGVSTLNMVVQSTADTDPADRYVAEYGGEVATYQAIFEAASCEEIEAYLEQSVTALEAARSGSPEYEAATGYLTAAEVVHQGSNCDG